MPTLTVFTPAFNRAYSIHLCYESLLRQTCKDFIWMIIDDGSSDNTRELIANWQEKENGFEIKYIYKQNGGMHTAHNTAYENIDTELNVCIDSDDYMTDDAVESILGCWHKNKAEQYAGIVALDITIDGNVIGTELPTHELATTLRAFYGRGGKGDKKLIYRTAVMKQYPSYPVFEGEKYVGLAYKYTLADNDYELVILNKPVCVVEYQLDGSSTNMFKQYLNNPKGFAFIRTIDMQYDTTLKRKFITCAHYVSSSILSKDKEFIKKSPQKLLTIFAIPLGIALTVYIKKKSRGFMSVEGMKR